MNVLSFDDHNLALPILQELVDRVSYRIVVSIISAAKNVTQIAMENDLPLSSTYKKVRTLQEMGIVSIERIDVDDCGKKILYYRSKIKSLEFSVTEDKMILQFEKNDRSCTRAQEILDVNSWNQHIIAQSHNRSQGVVRRK
jgi:predicted transcriptional regulator